MRLKSIELEGFQSYQERETVDVEGLSLVAVIGANGSGKTTLLNGIEFALFGKYRGDGINSVIARGAKKAEVVIVFDLNDATYRVRRVKTASRHEVYVYVADEASTDGWRVLEEKNPRMVDPFLVELLGMDYGTARATWLISQNDYGAFCELQPGPRRAVLTNAFGLNRYAELAEKADGKMKEAARLQGQTTFQLEQLELRKHALENDVADAELHELSDEQLDDEERRTETDNEKVTEALTSDLGDSESLQIKVAEAQTTLREVLTAHEREVERRASDVQRAARAQTQASTVVQGATAQYEKAAAASWDVDDLADEAQKAAAQVEEIEQSLPALRQQVTEWAGVVSAANARMENTTAAATEINERLEALQHSLTHGHDGECFACGQQLSPEKAEEMRARLEDQKEQLRVSFKDAQTSRGEAAENGRTASATVSTTEEKVRRARQAAQKATQGHLEAKRIAEAMPQLEKTLAEAKTALAAAEAEHKAISGTPEPTLDADRVQTLRGAVTLAEEQVAAAQAAGGDKQKLRARRDSLRAYQKRVWAEQSRRTRVAQELKDLVTPLKELEDTGAAQQKDTVTYEALRDAFRPAGIPAMILSGVIEELNDDANDILVDLGGQFGVNVTTQREKADGGMDEKVMVYVTTPEGEIDYTSLSGSERFRCALALRIALARCIARRTGTPMETIVMDEGWGALDDEYRQAVLEVLTELSSDFAVYTVSHIEEIKGSFPTVIEVSKATGTSHAEVVTR